MVWKQVEVKNGVRCNNVYSLEDSLIKLIMLAHDGVFGIGREKKESNMVTATIKYLTQP